MLPAVVHIVWQKFRKTVRVVVLTLMTAIPVSSFTNTADTQILKYEVIRNNKVIGHINAIKFTQGGATEYTVESTVNLDILFDYNIYSFLKGFYSNGQLTEGKIVRKVNGKEKTNAQIQWKNNQYIISEGNQVKTMKEKIVYSTACLMNSEPVALKKIFSENFGQFIAVSIARPHEYVLHLPDGNKNYYTYENGICTNARISTSLSSAEFRLKR